MATTENAVILATPSCSAKKRSQQRPLTYLRQVIALLLDPQLLASEAYGCYPPDLVAKARRILGIFPGTSIGSYTHTGGHLPVREACAQFLTRRDGADFAARLEDVHVTSGSTEAIRLLLEAFGRRAPRPAGVLVPAPGCGMYEAFARQVGVLPTRYRLGNGPEDGDGGCWQLVEAELEAAYQSAIDHGCDPRILVVINPGSPTGHLLTDASLRLAAEFSRRRGLFVLADETLQFALMHEANADASAGAFKPFRRVALETERHDNAAPLEVASLASLSRGVASGEAGLRTGFMELLNLHPVASATLLAVLACTSCPPVLGQAALVAALTPPEPGEASHAGYKEEISEAASSLRRRAALVRSFFADRPDCGQLPSAPVAGAFAYARLRSPPARRQHESQQPGVISIANELLPIDASFCRELADRYGVAAQPGSAFGQPVDDDGLWFYIRLSLNSSDEDLAADLSLIEKFHAEFVQRFVN